MILKVYRATKLPTGLYILKSSRIIAQNTLLGGPSFKHFQRKSILFGQIK